MQNLQVYFILGLGKNHSQTRILDKLLSMYNIDSEEQTRTGKKIESIEELESRDRLDELIILIL